jgi:alpha-L-fucosidase
MCLVVLAVDASAGDNQTGWEKILVPADPINVNSVPSPGQLRYQMNQYGAFLHYGPAVFLNGDWQATPDPKVFNPTELDAEQWVRVAKSFDAKHLVFSTKHHNGFCLWPTKTTDYSVRRSPWKNGQGDVVREVAEACKKHGIALGLYFSGQDRHFPCHILDKKAETNRETYWPVYCRQLEELLTSYGELVCLWLDGYGDPFDWQTQAKNPKTGRLYGDEVVDLVKAKQPNAVICNGTRPELRYCCIDRPLEDGIAPYPLWNAIRKGEPVRWFTAPWAQGWIIPETYNCHGTFAWVPTTPDKLLEQYYQSVGRGANFLQALVPDKRGLIDDAQAKAVADFGAEVRRRFGSPIAQTDSARGWIEPGILELNLGGAKNITHVVLEEDIAKGQHVLKYGIDVWAGGAWKTVAEGQSIGRKRIERFEPAIAAQQVRFRVVQANAIPTIRAISVHDK